MAVGGDRARIENGWCLPIAATRQFPQIFLSNGNPARVRSRAPPWLISPDLSSPRSARSLLSALMQRGSSRTSSSSSQMTTAGMRRVPCRRSTAGRRATYDRNDRKNDYILSLRHQIFEVGHIAVIASKSPIDLGMDAGRVEGFVNGAEADVWVVHAGSRAIPEETPSAMSFLNARLSSRARARYSKGLRSAPLRPSL